MLSDLNESTISTLQSGPSYASRHEAKKKRTGGQCCSSWDLRGSQPGRLGDLSKPTKLGQGRGHDANFQGVQVNQVHGDYDVV